MMLEIARFWRSIAHFNPRRKRWEIHGVMGPDEFHERHPDATEGGLRNNAYTNVMVADLRDRQAVLDLLPASRREALRRRTGLTDAEIGLGRHEPEDVRRSTPTASSASSRATRTSSSLEWDDYRARHGNIQRLDRILRAEGDDPTATRSASRRTR